MVAENSTFWLRMFKNQLKTAWSTNSWLPDFSFCLLTLVTFFSASKSFSLFLTQVDEVLLGTLKDVVMWLDIFLKEGLHVSPKPFRIFYVQATKTAVGLK